ncbi:MAG: hypothetical protein E7F71_13000 [Clostridium perfringens]|nr:hypothetical protein [Clostridium perfringens]
MLSLEVTAKCSTCGTVNHNKRMSVKNEDFILKEGCSTTLEWQCRRCNYFNYITVKGKEVD